MARHKNFDLNFLIANLRGSTDPIDEMLDSLWPGMGDYMTDMTTGEMELLDSKIFRCINCGTWEPMEKLHHTEACDQYCNDCS
jgi:hypothetical protein